MIATSFLFVAVLVTSIASTPLENEELNAVCKVVSLNITNEAAASQLYNSVVVGDYKYAVVKTFALENSGRSDVIVSVINRLLSENQRNIVGYAYKLWNTFGQTIVKDYFPIEFRLILNNEHVQVINRTTNETNYLALYYMSNSSNSYSYPACSTDNQYRNFTIWRFVPVWEDETIYFKIFNMQLHTYMYLSYFPNSEKYLEWHLVPIMYKGTLLFQIMSRSVTNYRVSCTTTHNLFEKKLLSELELYGWNIKSL